MWSDKFNQCKKCNSTKNKHRAFGLCTKCYLEEYRNNPQNKNKIKQSQKKWYKKQPKGYSKELWDKHYFGGKKEKAMKRDDFTCKKCGEKDISKLIVHHIDESGGNGKKTNNKLNNLITMCRSCHMKLHREHITKFQRCNDNNFWSLNYDKCVICKTTDNKHNSRGICIVCYGKIRYQAKIKNVTFEDIVRTYRKL